MTEQEAINILMSDADFSGQGEKAKKTADALCLAIEAIEKQTPKKPKITLQNGYCGKCGIAWGYARLIEEQHCGYRYFQYCPSCGQAIDWSEE